MKTFRITATCKTSLTWSSSNKMWVDAPNKREARKVFRQSHPVKQYHIEEIVEQKQDPFDVLHLFEDGAQ